MRKTLLLGMALALIAAGACSSSDPTSPPPPGSNQVQMQSSSFSPRTITINAGESVTWVNGDSRPHTSTSGTNGSSDGAWDSGSVASGDSFTRTFNSAGTFPYYCTFHWQMGMTGSVQVNQ